MNFSVNKLPRKDRTSSFLTYGEAGKRVPKFQANFSKVFEVLSSNDGSNFIQIWLLVSNLLINIIQLMNVDQPLRDKPLKTAFGSTEKTWKHSKTHRVSLPFATLLQGCISLFSGRYLERGDRKKVRKLLTPRTTWEIICFQQQPEAK